MVYLYTINDLIYKELESFLKENTSEISKLKEEADFLEKEHKGKKDEEISQTEKDDLKKLRDDIDKKKKEREEEISKFGKDEKLVRQLIDLALLSNNMLKGEDLSTFVKRSIELL